MFERTQEHVQSSLSKVANYTVCITETESGLTKRA